MKKRGFTLIELLAVIVVLAIIAIIAIPIITNVIDKAKMGALKDSGYGIIDAAEMYLAKNMDKEKNTMEFICNNGKCLSGEEEINYKGQIETGRVRIYSDSKIELCIENNNSSALKTVASKEVVVSKGSCNYEELNYGVTALVSKTALDEMTKKYNDLKALVDQTDITAEDIKEGKKAYSNGEVITGISDTNSINSFNTTINASITEWYTGYDGGQWVGRGSLPIKITYDKDLNIMSFVGSTSVKDSNGYGTAQASIDVTLDISQFK